MHTTRLILVGGFLAAGKTTLLWEAARRLAARGEKVGLITNDQAPDLVDTRWLEHAGIAVAEGGLGGVGVAEVAGSCFCCNFAGLIDASQRLADTLHADVLIAEPVGSCTDLSATILQPLKENFSQQFALAPLSVLADPARLAEVVGGRGSTLHDSTAYIFRKQLEEADLIVLNKIDLFGAAALDELRQLVRQSFPQADLVCISAQTGEGVDEWLDAVLAPQQAGRTIAEVDYDVYAEGEAVLGWLNSEIQLAASGEEVDWRAFCRDLLGGLQEAFQDRHADVGHVKLLLSCPQGECVGNLIRTGGEISLRGRIGGFPPRAELVLNARVAMPPEELEQVVRAVLGRLTAGRIDARVVHMKSLRPGRPVPTYRYARTL